MTTKTTQKDRYFCIFDYFLDGVFLRWEEVFLKWEEVREECPVFITGQNLVVSLEDGTKITGKIVETDLISEDERRIFLSSC